MARKDNAITGDSTRVEILFNGVPQNITNMVQNFNPKATYETIETRHLGSTGVDVDKTATGWEGDLVISRKTPQIDDMINAYNLALRTGVPFVVAIVQTDVFRDGSSRTWVYPDCQLEFETSYRRGQAVTSTVKWTCGTDRI